ncbi:fatty acid synthase-like [Lycorma delicatula]|uniref:fatty acid synthase-like n=1 Tax=Lycorma delicatula TaxID=130591 RepID=UPI003F50F525
MGEKFEVVISGMGGSFPMCENVEDLKHHLFNKINMVTVDDERWLPGEMGVPAALSKIKGLDCFDATFFGIHRKLGICLDPLTKLSMERAFEAIVDAGVNPSELSGTNTAVVMSSCLSESDFFAIFDVKRDGFGILGHNKAMQANRVSYFLNLTGPSYSLDSSWTGGMQSLKIAFDMIADGHCNAAIVGVASVALQPNTSIQFLSMGKLNFSGETKSFSADADGYGRGEACVVFFLQRKEDAKRSYGTIINVKSSYIGERNEQFLESSSDGFKSLLEETYNESSVDPSTIAYLEADGTGIKSQDTLELNTAEKVFCKNRKDPLLIGSIKSNLGHTEGSSSLVSVVKGLMAMDLNVIPPNIHYSTPNPAVPGLLSGKMKVVTETTCLPGNVVGVSAFGISGGCGHVILKQNPKKKVMSNTELPSDGIPRIFIGSARDEAGIKRILDKVSSLPVDAEFFSLTHEVWNKDISGHLYRGYVIMPSTDPSEREYMNVTGGKQRPIWFIFSGMGSQWTKMGTCLLKLPVFKAAIDKCDAVLKPKGIDVFNIITTDNPDIFNSILNSFIGISAIQIGLVDLLNALGIKPDGMVGHSVGELGCAYADGCFTVEQMILSAYARGMASIETPLDKGMMAAVGLGCKQMEKENLPESIDIACHNSADSCTLSGPAEDVDKYISELKKRNIFAKLVNVADIAYHSRYIAPAAPALLKYLKDVIPDPKLRSERWISSSVPESEWNKESAKYCSAEYFTNNLLGTVLFEEASKHIPDNAIAIEIAPHGLLQAILRKSLKKNCINIPLTQRRQKDGLRFFLSAVGKMYLGGLLPDVKNIYPPVEYPVSCGTAPLSNLVSWDHSEDWKAGSSIVYFGTAMGARVIEIDFNNDKWHHFLDHTIKNNCLILPTSAYLLFAWESLILMKKETKFSEPVIFEDVKVHNIVELPTNSISKLTVLLSRCTGYWEINNAEHLVASGVVREANRAYNLIDEELSEDSFTKPNKISGGYHYKERDVYNILQESGYVHKKSFRTIKQLSINNEGMNGTVMFNDNWLQFLDGILKVYTFQKTEKTNLFYIPTHIRRLVIEPSKFDIGTAVEFTSNNSTNVMKASGLKLYGVNVENISVQPTDSMLHIDEYRFTSHSNPDLKSTDHLLNVTAQLVFENYVNYRTNNRNITILGLESDEEQKSKTLSSLVEIIFKKYSNVQVTNIPYIGVNADNFESKVTNNHSNLLIVSDNNHLKQACEVLNNNKSGFLLVYCNNESKHHFESYPNILKVFEQKIDHELNFIVYRKTECLNDKTWSVVYTSNNEWSVKLNALISDNKSTNSIIYLIICGEPLNGVHGFVKSLDNSFDTSMIRFIFLLDEKCPIFSHSSAFYCKQIALDLSINVYKNGSWGNYYKIPVKGQIVSELQGINLTQLHRLKCKQLNLHCLGLNLKMMTLDEDGDIYKSDLGPIDYSGIQYETGERIMGLAPFESGMTLLQPDPDLCWPLPDNWNIEDAVTVPFTYSLAYYSLIEVGHLKDNEKVIIHCGYTPLGQAAISVALRQNCEIYTTYFKSEQIEIIRSRFPQLSENNFLKLDKNFDVELLHKRNGSGVDVIMNCFAGNYINQSLNCLNVDGRFLHLGQSVKDASSSIGMFIFLRAVSFYGIVPENLLKCSKEVKHRLKKFFNEGVADGTVTPFNKFVTVGVCTDKDATELIRSASVERAGKKVVCNIHPGKSNTVSFIGSNIFLCDPEKSYIVIGGRGTLWLDVVTWLCERGARNFLIGIDNHLMSSSVTRRYTILLSKYSSCKIQLVTNNYITSETEAEEILSKASSLGPVDGIFFVSVNDVSKISLLDIASRKIITDNTLFVTLLCENSIICENRREDGLSGVTINCDKPFTQPSKVLLVLDQIFCATKEAHILISEDIYYQHTEEHDYLSSKQLLYHIPESISELIDYSKEVGETCFVEVPTLSPPYKEVKDVSPVFIIGGFKPQQLDKLTSQLYYPIFKAKLPADISTIKEAATNLIQAMKDFPNLEAFTLIGVGWGGLIALKIASILEAEHKLMSVILLDSEPYIIQRWASVFEENMDIKLINKYFNFDNKAQNELSELRKWEDCIEYSLKNSEKNIKSEGDIKLALTALRNHLKAVVDVKRESFDKLKYTSLYLYRLYNSSEEITSLGDFGQTVKVIISNETNIQSMIDSRDTIRSVNSNVCFYYKNVEQFLGYFRVLENRIIEGLGTLVV